MAEIKLSKTKPSSSQCEKKSAPKKAPHSEPTRAVSRHMIAVSGTLHEQHAIIKDLMARYQKLVSTLPNQDRKTSSPIAMEATQLHKEAWRRIEQLPEGPLRDNFMRKMYA
jgi:hypothetical protein